MRGLGSDDEEFDLNRFRARGSFFYLRGSIAHTHDLPAGLQMFGKVQGQVTGQPLVNSEQLAGGGLATVRGYLEAEAIGDNGVFGSLNCGHHSWPGGPRARATTGALTFSPREAC